MLSPPLGQAIQVQLIPRLLGGTGSRWSLQESAPGALDASYIVTDQVHLPDASKPKAEMLRFTAEKSLFTRQPVEEMGE